MNTEDGKYFMYRKATYFAKSKWHHFRCKYLLLKDGHSPNTSKLQRGFIELYLFLQTIQVVVNGKHIIIHVFIGR